MMRFSENLTGVFIALCVVAALAVIAPSRLDAATTSREETKDGQRYLILENDMAKVVIWPDAGAAIIEYLDKRSSADFATKGVKKGSTGYSWKDITSLRYGEPPEPIGALPYKAELRPGKGYASVLATCTAGHLRVDREMRLADDSTALTIIDRHTNISDQPQSIWLRFHPYMKLDDPSTPGAVASAILLPGAAPTEMRRIMVGSGWDGYFMDVPGYWLAANQTSGVGIWMTFAPQDIMVGATWTGTKFGDSPKRGEFTAELFPYPRVVQPGQFVELKCAYQPFIAADKTDRFTMEFVPSQAQSAAARFLKLTRDNLPVVNSHTMSKLPHDAIPAIQRNIFDFSHRRRDRYALNDWGIADAVMAVPAVQSIGIRTRLFVHLFEGTKSAQTLTFKLTVTDIFDKVVKQESRKFTIDPAQSRVLDKREDFPINDLPDGRYTFTLEAYDGARLIHQYTEKRKLLGTQHAAVSENRVKTEQGIPLDKRERPFVTALRTVEITAAAIPIGVEDASGQARHDWPVRVGVPFAQGALSKQASVTLRSPDGKNVDLQTSVMGTWLDGSVKWLLVDFLADVPANKHVFYTLSVAASAPAPTANLARLEGSSIHVDTGLRQWAINPTDAKILGILSPADIWWNTADGRKYQFEIKGDGAGVRLVENGPLRAVIQITGWYFQKGNPKPIARGEFRAQFHRKQSWFQLDHTFTFAGDAWQDAVESTGVRFTGLLQNPTQSGVDIDGVETAHAGPLTLWQPDEDHAVLTSGQAQVRTGRRSTGAALLKSSQARSIIYHRHLWQMFPKCVEIDTQSAAMTFEYWPKRAGIMDWRPREDGWLASSPPPQEMAVGASRTHEFIIDSTGQWQASQYQPMFDEPVIAAVPPAYLAATSALMHLQPYDPNKVTELETHLSEALDSYILNQDLYGWYGEWHFGTLPNLYIHDEKRWADYGRYGNILNEQDLCHVPWLAYLRSGDRKYLKFAEANTRHLLEVGTIRLNPTFPDAVGMSRRHHECIWLAPADYGHSMLDPFLEMYHATGYLPAFEAAQRMAQGMARSHGNTDRYLNNPLGGLARMYLETQDPFYKTQADRIWNDYCSPKRNEWYTTDHGSRMALYYSQINPDCKQLWAQMAAGVSPRRPFQYLDSQAALYTLTGDKQFADEGLKHYRYELMRNQETDRDRSDPLQWGIARQPQLILAALREMMYGSSMLSDALKNQMNPSAQK
jgi:hypothetical protein